MFRFPFFVLAVQPWADHPTSLSLHLLTCEMGEILTPVSWLVVNLVIKGQPSHFQAAKC